MAFPRLNAFGFWRRCSRAARVLQLRDGGAPAIGWFAYAPLTEHTFRPQRGDRFLALGLVVSGVGTTTAGVNFIATILGMAPGWPFARFPSSPGRCSGRRCRSSSPYRPDRDSDHGPARPEHGGAFLRCAEWRIGLPVATSVLVLWASRVYILILPVFGMVSEIIPVFSRKVLFGYEFMAAATAAIAFISLGVWAHHMFAVGMNRAADLFFVVSSLLVSIPPESSSSTGWPRCTAAGSASPSPMLFVCGFLSMFLIGGPDGHHAGRRPWDYQLTDSYFVVGHFHWVLIGGTLFGTFAGIHYWYPKVTGRMLSERLARWQFWLLYVGFILTFGPMHIAGLMGMPRRIYTYEAGLGWEIWNQVTTLGRSFRSRASRSSCTT